jgi:hypothetical protein
LFESVILAGAATYAYTTAIVDRAAEGVTTYLGVAHMFATPRKNWIWYLPDGITTDATTAPLSAVTVVDPVATSVDADHEPPGP